MNLLTGIISVIVLIGTIAYLPNKNSGFMTTLFFFGGLLSYSIGNLGVVVSYFPADTRQAPVSSYVGGTTMIFPKAHNSQSGGLSEK